MNPKAKRIIKIVVDVLLWAFLALSLLMTILAFTAQASNAGIPKLGNTYLLTVQSDSMNNLSDPENPEGFKKGDLIISHAPDEEEQFSLQKGDVVTFYIDMTYSDGTTGKELNTHKIIETGYFVDGRQYYRTQGVNPAPEFSVADKPITPDQVLAVWNGTRIPAVGSIIGFLQSSTGFLVCIVIPLALFFIYELIIMIRTIIQIKNKGKKQITHEDEEMIKQRAIEEYLARHAAELAAQQAAQTASDADAAKNNDSTPTDGGN